jgi:predicted anti-sigma-YlaC factor YlaD
MSHSPYREMMAAALDELLAPADRATLEAHLRICAACRAVWEALAEVDTLFHVAPMVVAPAGFSQRMASRLAARTSHPRLIGGGLILSLSAAAILGLVAVPLAGLIAVVLRQPGMLVAIVRALAAAINVLGAMGGGLWLAVTSMLDWAAGQPMAGVLALTTLPLVAMWIYMFNRLTPKAYSV